MWPVTQHEMHMDRGLGLAPGPAAGAGACPQPPSNAVHQLGPALSQKDPP